MRDIVRGYLTRTSAYEPFERDGGWWFTNPKGIDEGPFETRGHALMAEDWWHA